MADFLHTLFFVLFTIALFWLVSQSFIYNITNGIFGKFGFPLLDGTTPSMNGVLLHGVVLAIGVLILSGLLLPCKEKFKLPETEDKKNKKQN